MSLTTCNFAGASVLDAFERAATPDSDGDLMLDGRRFSLLPLFAVFSAALVLGSCARSPDHPTDLAALAGALASGGRIERVFLGMTFGELRRKRPAVRGAPYVGAFEKLNGDTIWYHLDPRPGDPNFNDASSHRPEPFALIRAIEARHSAKTNAEAHQYWTESIQRVGEKSKVKVQCFWFERDGGTLVALGSRGSDWVAVMRRNEVRMGSVAQPFVFPPAISLFVSSDLHLIVPRGAVRRKETCPRQRRTWKSTGGLSMS